MRGEDSRADNAPVAAVIDCYVLDEEGDCFFPVFGQMLLCPGMFGRFTLQDRSPCRLAERWFIKSLHSCSGIEWEREATRVC